MTLIKYIKSWFTKTNKTVSVTQTMSVKLPNKVNLSDVRIVYNEKANNFVLLGKDCDLYAPTLPELINKAKLLYNINLLSVLN